MGWKKSVQHMIVITVSIYTSEQLLSVMTEEDYREYNIREYEDFLKEGKEEGVSIYNSMWELAKYNPYAAYMFASRMEKGKIEGTPGLYYHRSAEFGCRRAFWKIVANPDYNRGVRDICSTYRQVINWRSTETESRDRCRRFRAEAVRQAAVYPVLWTAIAYGDLFMEDDESFMDSSKKAIDLGSEYAMFLRGRRLLELAGWNEESDASRKLADETIGLLRTASLTVWEAKRLLGEELWTGRWLPQDREAAVRLISATSAERQYPICWRDCWKEFLTYSPDLDHRGGSDRMEGALGRIGRRSCSGVAGACEWWVLMRVTYTGVNGITSYGSRRGYLGGYESDVFRINPWRDDRPDVPFFEFKPAGVKLYDPENPVINADMDMEDIRMMLRICAESVEGAI